MGSTMHYLLQRGLWACAQSDAFAVNHNPTCVQRPYPKPDDLRSKGTKLDRALMDRPSASFATLLGSIAAWTRRRDPWLLQANQTAKPPEFTYLGSAAAS